MERISIGISKGCSLLDYVGELGDIKVDELVEYSDDGYTRKVLYVDENIEVILIGWGIGQSSTIHDHPSNGCIYRILGGEMVEYRYNSKLNVESTTKLKKGDIGNMMDNRYYHKMSNESDVRASSLHIYSPPNYKMNIYDK
jgi:cysteine dioxygenase